MVTSFASAGLVNIAGNSATSIESTGSQFTGSMNYVFNSGTTGTMTITLNNTTSSSVGGYLTGFVFDIASMDSSASATLSSTTNSNFLNTGSESAAPFGMFDAGAALGANWTGGGNPNGGIGAGLSAMFVFNISASDASSLTTMSFLGMGTDLAVRFRGLNNGGSDKILIQEQPPLNIVPLPTGVLAGAGMLGLGLGVRTVRRIRK